MNSPSRRAVLVGSAIAVGAAAIGGGALLVNRSVSSRSAAARALFGEAEADARALGELYLADVPDDPVITDPEAVPPGAVPEGTADPLEWFTTASPAEVATTAFAGCGDDFAGGRTIELRGWVLPATAAELCALTEVD